MRSHSSLYPSALWPLPPSQPWDFHMTALICWALLYLHWNTFFTSWKLRWPQADSLWTCLNVWSCWCYFSIVSPLVNFLCVPYCFSSDPRRNLLEIYGLLSAYFALLPTAWATRCFMWGDFDMKGTWLHKYFAAFVEQYMPKPDGLPLRLLGICSRICCLYCILGKVNPLAQAVKCCSFTLLSLLFWFWKINFCLENVCVHSLCHDNLRTSIVPATHEPAQSNIWIQNFTTTTEVIHVWIY